MHDDRLSELMNINEAAKFLGCSKTTVDRWARDGNPETPKPVNAWGRRRWIRSDLQARVDKLKAMIPAYNSKFEKNADLRFQKWDIAVRLDMKIARFGTVYILKGFFSK